MYISRSHILHVIYKGDSLCVLLQDLYSANRYLPIWSSFFYWYIYVPNLASLVQHSLSQPNQRQPPYFWILKLTKIFLSPGIYFPLATGIDPGVTAAGMTRNSGHMLSHIRLSLVMGINWSLFKHSYCGLPSKLIFTSLTCKSKTKR